MLGRGQIYLGFQGWFNIEKSIYVIHHINSLRKKNNMIISIDRENALDKIRFPFMIKIPRKLGIEGNFLNLINISVINIIFNGKML